MFHRSRLLLLLIVFFTASFTMVAELHSACIDENSQPFLVFEVERAEDAEKDEIDGGDVFIWAGLPSDEPFLFTFWIEFTSPIENPILIVHRLHSRGPPSLFV